MQQVTIIGMGLIGGSLGLALRRAKYCDVIVGFDTEQKTLQHAVEIGAVDCYQTDLYEAVAEADLVVLALPPGQLSQMLIVLAPLIRVDMVITDTTSVKSSVINDVNSYLKERSVHFVPGHPIAGREQNGIVAADSLLFKEHMVILTPDVEVVPEAIASVKQMWQAVGAQVVCMESTYHDQLMAAISHLPHMLAYSLVGCLADLYGKEALLQYAAGGFADFTRIASSNPQMWRDICLSNRQELLQVLATFERHMNHLHKVIDRSDGDALMEIFSNAKEVRDQFMEQRAR